MQCNKHWWCYYFITLTKPQFKCTMSLHYFPIHPHQLCQIFIHPYSLILYMWFSLHFQVIRVHEFALHHVIQGVTWSASVLLFSLALFCLMLKKRRCRLNSMNKYGISETSNRGTINFDIGKKIDKWSSNSIVWDPFFYRLKLIGLNWKCEHHQWFCST